MSDTTICIYFADTGGGHRSVANAIAAGMLSVVEKNPQLPKIHIIKDLVIEKSHPFSKALIGIYNYLATYHTTWIKYYAFWLQLLRPESYYVLYRPYVYKLLKEHKPALIVSVHPMLAQCMMTAVRELNLTSSVKIAVVVTDPNEHLWRAWACQNVDLIIVPNQIVRSKLIEWNMPASKIQVLGMPVNPKFLSLPVVAKAEFLSGLGLSPGLFTICINCGWAGNAHLLDTYKALKKCARPLQVIFLSGYNRDLEKQAKHAAIKCGIQTVVLPFYDQMFDLMSAVDVMVTKAGGLTTYEALVKRLPLVLDKTIEPMPQEALTLKMLVDAGVAIELNHPEDIVGIIDGMRQLEREKIDLPKEYQLNLTERGIFDISKSLLCLANSQMCE